MDEPTGREDAAALARRVRALRHRYDGCLSEAERALLGEVEDALWSRVNEGVWWDRAERASRLAESLARIGGLLSGWA